MLEQVAFANIVLASVAVIVAAPIGYLDNLKTYSGAAPNAMWKITLAIILFILTVSVSIIRSRNPDLLWKGNRFLYMASLGVSFAITIVLGFLGSIILYGF